MAEELSNSWATRNSELFALLEAWAPEEALRRMILSDNRARCFG